MASSEFDVAVIGAGPAGAACALAAARANLSVLLVDPQGDARDKPCGEGIMPSGIRVLEELGLANVTAESLAFRRLRFMLAGHEPLDVELEAEARAVPRPKLLELLDRALSDEPVLARVRAHARADADGAGFSIRTRPLDGDSTIRIARARVLVAADGSGGHAATWLRGPRRARRSRRIGVRARFALDRPLDNVEIYMGAGADVYLTPLPHGAVNVAVLLDEMPADVRGADELCAWALDHHPAARAGLGRVITPASARSLDRAHPRCVARGDAFLVGDAAGAVDPILGCGVALALESGVAAARAAEARKLGLPADDVARAYRRAWRGMAAARMQLAHGLRFLSAHPRAAAVCLELLRRSDRSRRWLCRIAAGDATVRDPGTFGRIDDRVRALARVARG